MRSNAQIVLAALAVAIQAGQQIVVDSYSIPIRAPLPCPIELLAWEPPRDKNRQYDAPGRARRKKGKR